MPERASVGERYQKAGRERSRICSRSRPAGNMGDWKDNEIDAFPELTSTAKVTAYRAAYQKAVLDQPGTCLGSYAFMWGQEQEVTALWFSLLLPDGSRLGAVDALSEFGQDGLHRIACPEIASLSSVEKTIGKPGRDVAFHAQGTARKVMNCRSRGSWFSDQEKYGTGGDAEESWGDDSLGDPQIGLFRSRGRTAQRGRDSIGSLRPCAMGTAEPRSPM